MPVPASETLDLVFLGCGEAALMHGRTLSRLDGVRVHFASRDHERAESFREERDGGRAYGSYASAIEDDDIDVAMVTTPPSRHLELTLRALDAGRHVIVEKPAFLHTRDFDRVRKAEADSGRRTFVAENYYYKPLRERLHRILGEGLIGEPLFINVDAVRKQEAPGWRSDPELAGGGALFEGGIHWINFMASLGLDVVRASGHRAGTDGGPDGSAVVVLDYRGGAVGTLCYSWEVPSPLRGLRISKIYGREGSVTFESNGAFVFLHGRRTRFYVPRPLDIAGFSGMFRDILAAVRTGDEPAMTLDMAERDVRLVRQACESFRASAADGPRGESP